MPTLRAMRSAVRALDYAFAIATPTIISRASPH